jgi:hypothetical protein
LICFGLLNSVHEGTEHGIAASVGADRNSLIGEAEIMISRSMIEKRGLRWHDLMLDRLSEHEKVDASFIVCR